MVRITSGKYRNRILFTDLPKGVKPSFRPTQAKTRDAVLNKLNFSNIALDGGIQNKRVLDLFCGTGAFGFEALSRGASFICFVDKVKENIDLVRRSSDSLGASDQCLLLQSDASNLPPNTKEPYDIIYLDPPYYKNDLLFGAINSLLKKGWISPSSLIVIEIAEKQELPCFNDMHVLSEAKYGASKVIYLSQSKIQ
jgi:16S rRNA (guanine966-N2)-methyltransferase